jgi:hypothetical protein
VKKMDNKTVLGIFKEKGRAEDVIHELESRGYNPKDISIVMRDKEGAGEVRDNTGADVAGDTVGGAATGAVIGGIAGLVSAIAIPGLGAFFIGGPIAAALGLTGAAATTVSGAATGALAGGLIGALSNLGLSKEDAEDYERRINEGGILVAVPARSGEESEVRSLLESKGGDQIRVLDQEVSGRTERRDRDYEGMERSPAYYTEVKRGEGDEDRNTGRGWHEDSREHAKAAKGKKVRKDR